MHHELHRNGLLQQTNKHGQDAQSQCCINCHLSSVHPGDGSLRELETEDENTEADDDGNAHVEDLKNPGEAEADAHAQLAAEQEGSPAEVVERDGCEQCTAEVEGADHVRTDFGAEADGTLLRHLGEDGVGLDHDPVEACLLLEEAEEEGHPGCCGVFLVAACLAQADSTRVFC